MHYDSWGQYPFGYDTNDDEVVDLYAVEFDLWLDGETEFYIGTTVNTGRSVRPGAYGADIYTDAQDTKGGAFTTADEGLHRIRIVCPGPEYVGIIVW